MCTNKHLFGSPMNKTPKRSVFIADDDEDDRLLLEHAFAIHSPECHLLFAEDGLALFDALALENLDPCLIVLDVNMPRLNGFEALVSLRRSPKYGQVPIVILTTSSEPKDKERALALGANEFLTKPFTRDALGKLVCHLRRTWHLEKCN